MRAHGMLVLAGLPLLLAACGKKDEGAAPGVADGAASSAAAPANSASVAPAASTAPSPAPAAVNTGTQATLELAPLNNSGYAGEVTAIADGATSTLTLTVSGAPADSSVAAHIHYGRCAAPGNVTAPLTPIDLKKDGKGTSTTTVNIAMSTLMDGGHYVQVHKPDGTPAACGDLPKGG
ncbi:MAG: hypothetical protein JWM27_2035 [Gemmatimonadetes bacterium]|nr:hypothetical protein [Gemmatimonadota bacterium]